MAITVVKKEKNKLPRALPVGTRKRGGDRNTDHENNRSRLYGGEQVGELMLTNLNWGRQKNAGRSVGE